MSWEELSVDQRWHYRNRDWNTERTLRRRGRLRKWINETKAEAGCDRCRIDDPACLDYHHPDGGKKRMDIGTMVTYGHGKDALESEMELCTILCANCHRKEHASKPTEALRKWVYEQKNARGGCSKCDEGDTACLDFHHTTDKKTDTIARMVGDGRPWDAIRTEMQKCAVLCANCHRKLHFVPPGRSGSEHDNNK